MAVVVRGRLVRHAVLAGALVPVIIAGRSGSARSAFAASVTAVSVTNPVAGLDSLFGRSGRLRMRLVAQHTDGLAIGVLTRLFGDSAVRRPGVYSTDSLTTDRAFAFITLRPFSEKVNGWVNGYHIGYWPAERGRRLLSDTYANPQGFIEVTAENANMRISEHFQLRDFLTHDQQNVWPKYLVLREELVDKLELVIQELRAEGHPVGHLAVMSGFRTPYYNANEGETGGRAGLSRHMYGDAADVYVDNDGNQRMDDLNHDGRVDYRDARVILHAVEQVEHRYPDLEGGVGVYRATRSHGPFAHVDVRGRVARWGRI